MTDTLCYVYGIVSSSSPPGESRSAPSGVEGGAVTLLVEGDVAALVTEVRATVYGAEPLESATADVAWVGPRAVDHDLVLTWASDQTAGAVVPLPMFSLFRDESSVRAMLRERSVQLLTVLERVKAGREYTVRLYRIDAELRGALSAMSERIAALEGEAERASPGQRYLIERKLEAERKTEGRRVGLAVATRLNEELSAASRASANNALPTGVTTGAAGTLLSSAAFLVAPDALESFQRAVTTLTRDYSGRGFRIDFTGPWPPYHFANDDG